MKKNYTKSLIALFSLFIFISMQIEILPQDHNISTNPNAPTVSSGGSVSVTSPNSVTLTQTESQVPVAGSVSCNAGGLHSDNSYFRAYTLSTYGITGDFTVSAVQIGVEQATGATGTQPITVRIYTSSTTFPAGYPGSLTQIGTATINIADQNLTLYDVPVTGTAPAGSQLVVELFTPDGQTAGNTFFIGSNSSTQTAQGYMLAADCGITAPTTTTAIGFPDMHIILNVVGTESATPVELTSFTANSSNGNVSLNWATATETNNKGFEVQKKVNGSFATVAFVSGKGTTTERHSYSYTDKNVTSGNVTYRLKQVDFNGNSSFSSEAVATVAPANFVLEQNYPNPFNPTTNIKFALTVDSKVSMKIYNAIGQEVKTLVNASMPAGSHTVSFSGASLNSGVYFYKLVATGIDGSSFSSVKKMMLTK